MTSRLPLTLCDSQNWLQQVYKGHNTPFGFGFGNPVKVTSGKTTKGIDARLRLGGEISGIVTARSGRKLGGICVDAEGHRVRRLYRLRVPDRQ